MRAAATLFTWPLSFGISKEAKTLLLSSFVRYLLCFFPYPLVKSDSSSLLVSIVLSQHKTFDRSEDNKWRPIERCVGSTRCWTNKIGLRFSASKHRTKLAQTVRSKWCQHVAPNRTICVGSALCWTNEIGLKFSAGQHRAELAQTVRSKWGQLWHPIERFVLVLHSAVLRKLDSGSLLVSIVLS